MKKRPRAPKLTEVVIFRCSKREKNRMRMLARIYAEGDLSAWLRHCATSGERAFLKKKGFTPSDE